MKKDCDELIDRWYDMWMREGQREAQLDRLRQFDSGNIKEIMPGIRAPTLLLWGEADTMVDFQQSAEYRQLLANTESLDFISYPGVGHLAIQEAGARIGKDVRAYLDGTSSEE